MNVFEIITERILEKLQSGVVPWHKSWAVGDEPANFTSKKPYRGINTFWLACQGYASPYWLSYKQCQALGGQVKKGEKATPVVFFSWFDTKETKANGDAKQAAVLRYYNVFNVAQCEGLENVPESTLKQIDFVPIEKCEGVVAGMPLRPTINHDEQRAYYSPTLDYVNMPKQETFTSAEHYYSVLFHELTHSTGHENRLNRKCSTVPRYFGDSDYSKEELVVEMGAAFLCGHCSIENTTIDQSAAYIEHWTKALRGDSKLVVFAASQAQKAAEFILNIKQESGE